jgi:excisionase family DNA binding protein
VTGDDLHIVVTLAPEQVEAIAVRAAAIAVEQLRSEVALPRWLTVEQAAAYTQLERGTIYNWLSDGRLARRGTRGHRLVDRLELDRLLRLSDG